MPKFSVEKHRRATIRSCYVCEKFRKRGYIVNGIHDPNDKGINWCYAFCCSKRCADMYILSVI